MTEKEPKARFWVEARVATAKTAALIALAEADVARGDYAEAAVNAYYSLFHLGLSLLWLMPESMPEKLHHALIETRDTGKELPNKQISHKAVEDFLAEGHDDLSRLFVDAIKLREFASYGPRVTYRSDEPFVGPCDYKPRDVRWIVQRAPVVFVESLNATWSKTAYDGLLGPIIVEGARDLLSDAQFPFVGWFAPSVLERASQLIQSLKTAGPHADSDKDPI